MRMNALASRPGIGGVRPAVKVSPELFERIGIALDVARASQGLFDPTVGPLVRAWGFLPSPARPENRAGAVATARTVVGWEKVRLDAVQHTVQFAAPGMEIDLGGIAKGYATRKGAQVLRGHGIQSGLVSLGSSSMTAIGVPPGTTGWRVFIRDPRDGESPAAWIDLHPAPMKRRFSPVRVDVRISLTRGPVRQLAVQLVSPCCWRTPKLQTR